jgi:hypothetical protein
VIGQVSRKNADWRGSNRSRIPTLAVLLLGGLASFAGPSAIAQQVSREQDIGTLRLGQRIKVDDGSCPAGQVKEISGTKMTATGVARSAKCVPRVGAKTSPSKQYSQ